MRALLLTLALLVPAAPVLADGVSAPGAGFTADQQKQFRAAFEQYFRHHGDLVKAMDAGDPSSCEDAVRQLAPAGYMMQEVAALIRIGPESMRAAARTWFAMEDSAGRAERALDQFRSQCLRERPKMRGENILARDIETTLVDLRR